MHIVIIGGGPAGIFAAIKAAGANRTNQITVLEATDEPLGKVRISGGGRCNVTHHCFDPAELVRNYPRGYKELRGPFSIFQPRDTVAFFQKHGLKLKTEPDGRMFPITDSSETVIDCLISTAKSHGVELKLNARVKSIQSRAVYGKDEFEIFLHNNNSLTADRVMLATGSSPQGYRLAESLGHTIVPCVPSLFTFKIKDERLRDLSGISFEKVHLRLDTGAKKKLTQTGPMLITHWGLSGPAVLKLSAFGARMLNKCRYKAKLTVNFTPDENAGAIYDELQACKRKHPKRQIGTRPLFDVPKRYWVKIMETAKISDPTLWAEVSKQSLMALTQQLTAATFDVTGKGVFKEEFVTAGGVSLKEVDFKSMQSRICSGLFLGGEILDIDGITGGFNFQSAWTTGWIAGMSIAGGGENSIV